MRVAAACLVLVVAFGAGAAVMDSVRMGSSKAAMMDAGGEAESAQADGAYDDSVREGYDMEMAETATKKSSDTAADLPAETAAEDAASDEISSEEMTEKKLVYTSRLTVDTTDFDAYVEAVRQKVSELGGYIEQSGGFLAL